MRFKFFTIPLHNTDQVENELNRFLAGHRITSVEKHFVEAGESSAWSLCVGYVEGGQPPSPVKRGKIDYRDVLAEDEFAVFVKLRSLRKALAREGRGSGLCPVYQRAACRNGQVTRRHCHWIGCNRGGGEISYRKIRSCVS